MGANSLLDIVVFGRACALRIADIAKPGDKQPDLAPDAGIASVQDLDDLRFSEGEVSSAEIRGEMQQVMQEHAAVYRTSDLLSEGKTKIDFDWIWLQ